MARPLRIEFEGARYHVINRGNYRSDVFGSVGAAKSFLLALEEAVERFHWVLFGYVVMRNHYHLAIETPKGNLSAGMHWLQSTFSTRFNRLRKEHGHLFQGRFFSSVLEDRHAVRRVVDYIHLNPVRARVVELGHAADFRWSSLSKLTKKQEMKGLTCRLWLESLGLDCSAEGWGAYLRHLNDVAGIEDHGALRSAWAVGSQAWRRDLAKKYGRGMRREGLTKQQHIALQEATWEGRLRELLVGSGRSEADLEAGAKFANWKLYLARQLRDELGAKSNWLVKRLKMGKSSSLRVYLSKSGKINK